MKKYISILVILFFALVSCESVKVDPEINPEVSLSRTAGYSFRDTILWFGDELRFKIVCAYNGTDELSELNIFKQTTDSLKTIETISLTGTVFRTVRTVVKGASKTEKYIFEVTDVSGKTGRDSLQLFLFN